MRILADHTTTEGRYDLVEGTFPPNEATPAEPNSLPPTIPTDMEAFGRALLEIGDELVGPPPAVR